jgi:uncharacterized protein
LRCGLTGKRDHKCKHIAADTEAQINVIILDSAEEAFAALTRFANEAGISAASLTAIGAFERATVGWFDSLEELPQTRGQ